MQTTRSMPGSQDGAQYAVAVFDTWNALEALLRDLTEAKLSCRGAILHATGDRSPATVPRALAANVELHFSGLRVTCTRGEIADRLAPVGARAATLAHALQIWLSPDQALHLQGHVEKGHLLLWLSLAIEDSPSVCARLVQASPHVVEICGPRRRRVAE